MHGFSSGRLRIMPNKRIKKKPAKLKKTAAKKKAAVKTKSPGKKRAGSKTMAVDRRGILVESRNRNSEAFTRQGRRPQPAGQSGDLQGLSRVEGADSESVNELIGEGNAFEADVVAGVERAENNDEKEVRTHEVLENDVPGEYLDKN